jgi:3-dehydroquinate synthase
MPQDDDTIIRAPFAVPFEHRVHFTRGVFDPQNRTLVDALEPTADDPVQARVAFLFDAGLVNAQPDLPDRTITYTRAHDSIHLASDPVIIPGGEIAKNEPAILESVLRLIDAAHLCRRSYLIAVGGGALLDLAGYAAAIAHRGIRLVRLPSTTLAQDDSGVGVKNGINHFGKKNFLGSFAVPHAVINDARPAHHPHRPRLDIGLLRSRQGRVRQGRRLLRPHRAAAHAIAARDLAAAEPVIRDSALLHLRHITDGGDPFELTEARPLDFGHWSAHKLEQLSEYTLRHGEAVAIGVALDTLYSSLAGDLPEPDADRVLATLRTLGFTLDHPLLDDPRLLEGLEEFREHLGGRLTISLLHAIGDAYDTHTINPDLLKQSIARLRS